ncbi:Ig domain OX-2-like protein [Moosepox virus GoldyGopher14]|nr:Ig domain OX-2-like protein [Moosepox virus GoldyGopher14]
MALFFKLVNLFIIIKYVHAIHCVHNITTKPYKDVYLSCNKTTPFDSILITWEKNNQSILYYGTMGPIVVDKFKTKIKYMSDTFNTSIILIKNVSESDNGCYECTFNTLNIKFNDKGVICVNVSDEVYTADITINSNSFTTKGNNILTTTLYEDPSSIQYINYTNNGNRNGISIYQYLKVFLALLMLL